MNRFSLSDLERLMSCPEGEHLEFKEARMEEFLQVLPAMDRNGIQSLLRSLVREARIHVKGPTKAARWFATPAGSADGLRHD